MEFLSFVIKIVSCTKAVKCGINICKCKDILNLVPCVSFLSTLCIYFSNELCHSKFCPLPISLNSHLYLFLWNCTINAVCNRKPLNSSNAVFERCINREVWSYSLIPCWEVVGASALSRMQAICSLLFCLSTNFTSWVRTWQILEKSLYCYLKLFSHPGCVKVIMVKALAFFEPGQLISAVFLGCFFIRQNGSLSIQKVLCWIILWSK